MSPITIPRCPHCDLALAPAMDQHLSFTCVCRNPKCVHYVSPDRKTESGFRAEIAGLLTDAMINGTEVDLVGVIAGSCGWHDPDVGEKMTVHFGGKEYQIVRVK